MKMNVSEYEKLVDGKFVKEIAIWLNEYTKTGEPIKAYVSVCENNGVLSVNLGDKVVIENVKDESASQCVPSTPAINIDELLDSLKNVSTLHMNRQSGKTFTLLNILKGCVSNNQKCIFFVHKHEVGVQLKNAYRKLFGNDDKLNEYCQFISMNDLTALNDLKYSIIFIDDFDLIKDSVAYKTMAEILAYHNAVGRRSFVTISK